MAGRLPPPRVGGVGQADIKVCTISEDLVATLKKFRFRKEKTNAAVISTSGGVLEAPFGS